MATAAGTCRMESIFKVAIWSALYLLPITRALSPQLDFDVWWHLRTGQAIIEEQRIPTTDSFSRHGLETGKPWLAYSWLFEVLLYGFYQLLGLPGIVVLRLFLVLAVTVAVHRFIARRVTSYPFAASLFGAALLALGPLMSERPWLFTILFSTLLLDLLLDLREGRWTWWCWLLPVMFALWANLHIQFIYGLLILAIACLAPLLDRLLKNSSEEATITRAGSRSWWGLVVLSGLCALATLANPYHIRLYEVVLEYGTHQAPLDIVNELRPLEFRGFRDYVMPALAGVALFALGRRKQWSCFEVLLLIAAGWFSFRMRRDLWFMTIVALGILTTSRSIAIGVLPFKPTRLQGAALALVLILLAGYTWHVRLQPGAIEAKLTEDYPVEAVRFVKTQGYAGPLYNTFDWGGYLIWDLRELPVSMDGRTNLHGDTRVGQSYATYNSLPGWDHDPDLTSSGIVITDAGAPISATLRSDRRFKLVYEDQRAAVFEVSGSK